MNYFQDCSTFQSEELGVGFSYLKERNLVWVLSSWQIVVDRYPDLCEHVTIGTFPYEFKGCFGHRNFFMKDSQGHYAARANSLWTLLDTDSFRPARITKEMQQNYVMEEKMPMDYASRKINIPGDGSPEEEIRVKTQHLDTNHHVNNGQYVRMAMDFLPERFVISQMRAEYKKQALLHDILYPYVASQKGEKEVWTVSFKDAQDGVYVNVEFEGKVQDND